MKMKIEANRDDLSYIKKHIWETLRHIYLPYMNRRNVFRGEHMGPIYGSSHIWTPCMKRRKALRGKKPTYGEPHKYQPNTYGNIGKGLISVYFSFLSNFFICK
jgi:hypothetical protein